MLGFVPFSFADHAKGRPHFDAPPAEPLRISAVGPSPMLRQVTELESERKSLENLLHIGACQRG
jgi:hypothetical protein